MKEMIVTFFGKPISTMSREELLEVIKWFSKEEQKKEKRIQELEDENTKYLFGIKDRLGCQKSRDSRLNL